MKIREIKQNIRINVHVIEDVLFSLYRIGKHDGVRGAKKIPEAIATGIEVGKIFN